MLHRFEGEPKASGLFLGGSQENERTATRAAASGGNEKEEVIDDVPVTPASCRNRSTLPPVRIVTSSVVSHILEERIRMVRAAGLAYEVIDLDQLRERRREEGRE